MSEPLDETGAVPVEPDAPEIDAAADATTDTATPEAAAAAPAIDWNDPGVQAAVAGASRQEALTLLEQLGFVTYDTPKADGPQAPDPLSDNWAEESERYIQAKIDAALAPFQQDVNQRQAAETDAVIDTELTTAATTAGLTDADSGLLRSLAQHFATQPEYAKYGATIEGVQATAKAAADWIVNERKAAAERGVKDYLASLTKDGSTLLDPAIRGAALGVEHGEPASEKDAARAFVMRRQQTSAV